MAIRIRLFILTTLLIFSFGSKHEALAQSAGDFRSNQSGEWGDVNTWERFDGGTWVTPAPFTPTSADGIITIMDTHIVTVTSNVSVDQIEWDNSSPFGGLSGQIIVASGAVLTIDNGTGDDVRIINDFANVGILQIEGTLLLSNGATIVNDDYGNLGIGSEPVSPDTYKVTNGGVHVHTTGSGVSSIPNADWQSGSTCQVNATVSGTPSINPATIFHHFVWNGSSQSATHNLNGQLLSVNGDLIISNTNGSILQLSTTIGYTLSVLRDFIIQGNSRVQLNLSGNPSEINIGRNFEIASTSASPNAISFNATGTLTVNVSGDFSKSNGATAALCIGPTGSTVMNLLGNFSLTGGTLTRSNGSATINFNGTSTRTFTNTGTISNAVNFTVSSNKILDLGTSAITGTGNFVLNGTIRLGSTDPGGAIQLAPAAFGNIQVGGTRTYAANSSIEYNGTGSQFIGNGFPSSGDVNLLINNSNGVSLSNDLEIVALRILTLQSGNLVIGNQTLTINGTVTGSGGLIGGPTSNVVIGGTGNFGTLTFNGTSELLNFTINRTSSGALTLGGDLTVLGTLTQTDGDIVLNGNTLTISGNFGRTSGDLVVDGGSSIIVNGSGTLPATVGLFGTSLQTLTLNRASATFPFTASVTVSNLNLIDGALNNGTGLQIATGGTITRDAGTMSTSPGGSNLYNLDYISSGTINTGPEFHSNDTRVDNVEMNGGGTVTLSADRTINGDLILESGDFNIGSNTLTLEGNLIANSSSTLTGGTVVFDGNTTVSGSAVPTFGNIQVNNTRSLTFPSGDFDVAGNILFEAGATINSGSGTLLLSGGATQTISAGGASISNIRVDKTSGADVELTSQLVITGALRVVSANSNFASDGNLVLRSTSDGTSNNARIGQLLNGASVSGDVTVERFMAAEGRIYRYISAPVTGFTVAELQLDFPVTGSFTGTSACAGCTTNQSMFLYNGATQAYEDFPAASNSETLSAGIGYAAFVRQDVIGPPVTIDWTGPINQGTVSLPVSHNGTSESWNLVGNPYPSSIDWDNSGWTKVNIANSVSVRNNNTGLFQTWNGTTGNLPNGVIATGQGFWVRTTGGSPGLQVTEPVKTTATGEFFREASDELNQFILTLSDGTVEDQAFFWVSEVASSGLDDFDAVKLNNFRDVGNVPLMDLATYSYGEDALPMAINSVDRLNCGDIVKVYTNDLIVGNYELNFSASGFVSDLTWMLKDKFTGVQTNLIENPTYNFVVTEDELSKAVDRFELSIVYNPAELTSQGNTLISNYESGNQWYLNGVILEGENGKELVATESGLYTLEVNISGCISTTDRQFVVTNLENSIERTIRVYPNPANDKFKLEVDSAEPVRARLFNTMGIEVKGVEMTGSALIKQTEFDLSNQSNGMYILHVQKGGRVHQVKIIKTNE